MNHRPPHPGDYIRVLYLPDFISSQKDNNKKGNVTELAKAMRIGRVTLSRLLNCNAGVSVPMAFRLAKLFNKSAAFWLTKQIEYDLWAFKNKKRKSKNTWSKEELLKLAEIE